MAIQLVSVFCAEAWFDSGCMYMVSLGGIRVISQFFNVKVALRSCGLACCFARVVRIWELDMFYVTLSLAACSVYVPPEEYRNIEFFCVNLRSC